MDHSERAALAAGAEEGTVKLWEVGADRDLLSLPKADLLPVVALSADGKTLAVCKTAPSGRKRPLLLWDVSTGRRLATFQGHFAPIRGLAFGPDHWGFLTCSIDGTWRLWGPDRDEPVFSCVAAGDEWLSWTPEGYYTCSPNGEDLIGWKVAGDGPDGSRRCDQRWR